MVGGPGAELCSERFGSGSVRSCRAAPDGSLKWEGGTWRRWALSGEVPTGAPAAGGRRGSALQALSGLLAVFLPQGFPDSVSPDYLPYQLWDSVQAFASSLSGSLATHAVLLGLGVGNANASVSAATATWLLKDSTGMMGRIIFAWWKGSKLDCNAKQWRLFADILNDIAMFLEIMAPICPLCFTMTVSISNLAKCIVSVAGGATRAALTMHQARRNNMADVSAKDSSQETLVNLAGLLVSLLMLPLVSDCPSVFELKQLVEGHQEPYLLCWNQSQNQVKVVLRPMAGPETILRAATHGLILGALQEDGPLPGELEELRNQVRAGPKKESWIIVRETHHVLDTLFPKFLKGLQAAGWKTEKHQLEVDEWRATWPLSPEKKVL
ncbi:RUS1 family protein C16orf58 homolog isoform X4 [Nannospalax galili]|uniref:RUS1 family protein C16orf58 homolog isoform X4 n=1 Tax=Nannospalax galili TaxID=1026970 RepID=UPI00111C755E|nr:RUS1 family protein C16orf58 homolog isoform X4 [Nannospalax galili]